ncbi:MAG TPA: patatin-like phospholipase family protein [Pseudonocardiaceae bacterium]|nr:patatin-like phospholipase family protein [Pseudonocardiaceae bacterium]
MDDVEAGEPAPLRVLLDRAGTGQRNDGNRVVLAVEGGGNRGAISGAMAGVLYDEGLISAFDAVYGSSAGALTAAWILSSDPHRGLRAWADPKSYAAYTRMSNILRRRPVVDLEGLIVEFYDGRLGLDAAAVLASPVELHLLATDVDTGAAADLHPLIRSKATLHTAMQASAALPILAGRPVALGGHRYLDAGLSEGVPYPTPVADGATHVIVLRSKRLGQTSSDGVARGLTAAWLGRYSAGARDAFLARHQRAAELDALLARQADDVTARPAVLVVQPDPDTPRVSRLESDPTVIQAAMAAGRQAMRAVLDSVRQPRSVTETD